ncbi:DUF1917-domain-containing protein [Mytilinidion resinicola]|uniref:DUF1917-domain-containing protein n=1 Tax=Mytilinidion resinicola TaxID=574789 RepID=A0A6A6XZZ2_9PEZI|nr:DUF1917-domain-containing protein [Mytilinidion resinicola]KAF2801970.1 DUF1917-domain-containing protein [Mytilinidion resinicola]
MLGEDEMVSGSGWVSDESSFYGDEEGQRRLEDLSKQSECMHYWENHGRLLNTIALKARKRLLDIPIVMQESSEVVPAPKQLGDSSNDLSNTVALGAPNKVPETTIVLHNRMQGMPEAWQLGESIDDFVVRLPPATTRIDTVGPWIWVMNPYPERRHGSEYIRDFKDAGVELLQRYLEKRKQLEAENPGKAKETITKRLHADRDRLPGQIKDLAIKYGVLSGKWMFFPTVKDLPRMWKALAEAVTQNRLGIGAKVATDDGSARSDTRLICIYTYDFTDTEDVRRVLDELVRMGLVDADMPMGIFYKCDAYTHLDITGNNKYGLRNSLYSSKTMLVGERLSGQRLSAASRIISTPFSRMKQSTLNKSQRS